MSIERELIAINPLKDLETPSSCRSNCIPCYEDNSHFVFCTPRQEYSAKVTVTFRNLSFLPRGGWIGYLPDRLIRRPNKHLFAILPLVNNVQNVAGAIWVERDMTHDRIHIGRGNGITDFVTIQAPSPADSVSKDLNSSIRRTGCC